MVTILEQVVLEIVLRLEEFKVYGRQVGVQGGCESDWNLDEHI